MNFYQLGYFRTGKQGADAGWKLVAESEGLDYDAANGFKGIAANLVELKKTLAVPSHTLGVFQYERFVYLIHVNFAAQGSDDRGVTYVHGYCFNLKDYYELCRNPEKLLGIREENYVKEYDSSIKKYPVLSELSYDAVDYGKLKKKYGFSNEEYYQMIMGAICAAEGAAMPLCIKYTVSQDGYKQAYKEIMYLIMKGLPYHLRVKLTGYSYKGGGAAVYFSDTAEGNNYIDLDDRKFACGNSEIKSYGFVYACVSAVGGDRDTLFEDMAEITDEIFENSLYDNTIGNVNASFKLTRLKRNGVTKNPIKLLEYMLGCSLKKGEETYFYLNALLKFINKEESLITDEKLLKQLNVWCESCDDNDFKREVCHLNARKLLHGDKDEGFRFLLGLSHDFPEQYEMLCSAVEMQDKEFYREYYTEAYLPEYLTGLGAARDYLKDNRNLSKDEYCSVLSIVSGLTQKEFEKACSFRQLDEIETAVEEILEFIPDSIRSYTRKFATKMSFNLWGSFDPNRFEPREIEMYKHCDVEALSREKMNGEPCRNAKRVWALVQLFEEDITSEGCNYLTEALFTDEILSGIGAKERIRNLLREEKLFECDLSSQEGFDYSLALFYDFKKEQFDTLGWIKGTEGQGTDTALESSKIRRHIINSKVLKIDGMEEKLAQSIEEDVKKEKKSRYGKLNREQIGGLKLLLHCLRGEAEEEQEETEEWEEGEETEETETKAGRGFFCALHKVPVGMFALLAIAYWIMCLKDYADMGPFLVYMAAVVLAVIGVAAVGTKAVQSDGIGNLLKDCGLFSMSCLLVYICVFLAMAGGIAAVYFLPGMGAKLAGVFVLSLVSVLGVIIYGVRKEK